MMSNTKLSACKWGLNWHYDDEEDNADDDDEDYDDEDDADKDDDDADDDHLMILLSKLRSPSSNEASL